MKRRFKLSSLLFGIIIARAYDEGDRSIWLPGRSQTFINIFSPSQRVKPAPALDRRRHCQILNELQNELQLQISRSCKFWGICESCACTCKFCGLSNFKSSCDLTTARQLHKKKTKGAAMAPKTWQLQKFDCAHYLYIPTINKSSLIKKKQL